MIPKLTRFEGGPSADGSVVEIRGTISGGTQVAFSIDRDKVAWIFQKLAEWAREAARIAGWKPTRISGQDDSGIWMRPTSRWRR